MKKFVLIGLGVWLIILITSGALVEILDLTGIKFIRLMGMSITIPPLVGWLIYNAFKPNQESKKEG